MQPIAQEIISMYHEVLSLVGKGIERRSALAQVIEAVEAQVRSLDGATGPHPFPLEHEHADGILLRTIYSPAGTLVVGMRHRFAHFCFIERGDVSVLTNDGPVRMQAPCVFRSPAGSKRIVYHHTDTIWHTVHATEEMDPKKIEAELIEQESTIPLLSVA